MNEMVRSNIISQRCIEQNSFNLLFRGDLSADATRNMTVTITVAIVHLAVYTMAATIMWENICISVITA